MSIAFTTEELDRIEGLKARYPDGKAAIMPVLWMAQQKWGWLSEVVMLLERSCGFRTTQAPAYAHAV